MEEHEHPIYAQADLTQFVYFKITVEKVILITDIKEDGTLLLKRLNTSFSSAQAEPNSKVYFDYMIYLKEKSEDGSHIYTEVHKTVESWPKIMPVN